MRWKAERWMKVRHMPTVLRARSVVRAPARHRMLAHTFRGTGWKSVLGLESSRTVFRRYKAIRERSATISTGPTLSGERIPARVSCSISPSAAQS